MQTFIKMKISVVMAVYHGEKYLVQQLESLFHQTRQPDEIVIGDDSGDDGCYRIIESIRKDFSGELRYMRNSSRLGFRDNFKNLANCASGDIIYFSDQDDIWQPEKIATLAEVLEHDPAAEIVVCNSEMMDVNGNSMNETLLSGIPHFEDIIPQINAGKAFFPLINQSIQFSGHNMAVKKDFVRILNQIPEHYGAHDLWIQHTGALLGVLRYVDRPLTRFRVHAGNTSTPRPEKVRKSLLHRFHEISKSSNDIFLMAGWMRDLAEFMKRECPDNVNRELLLNYAQYFSRRIELLSKNRFFRLVLLVLHPAWLHDYLRYGVGTRSVIRDLIVKMVHCSDMACRFRRSEDDPK